MLARSRRGGAWTAGSECARCVPMGCVLLLTVGLLSAAQATALPPSAVSTQRPAFSARTLSFMQRDTCFVGVQVEIPYSELSFSRANGGMEASFDLILLAMHDGRQVAGDLWHEKIHVADRRGLHGRLAHYRRELLFPLGPGAYELEVTASEPASGYQSKLTLGARVASSGALDIRLSSLLLGPCGLTGGIATLLADRRIGYDFYDPPDTLCAYAEISHRGIEGGEVTLHWRLRTGPGGTLIHSGEERFERTADVTRLAWPIPIAGLGLETYWLEATAALGAHVAEGVVAFSVLAESESALDPFFRESLDALEYIANEDTVAALRMAAPNERKKVWDRFWKERDPTPSSERNEFKEEFFRRLRYANERFTAGRPGWRTDRGRIYIHYGPPDMVDRYPFNVDGPPREIWYYDQLGLRLLFVDRTGYGDYVLSNGTW